MISPSPHRRRRIAERGLSLIEILLVMALMAIFTGAAVAGSAQLPSSRLRRSATMIASAVKVAYTRATATSRSLRLVLDLDKQKIWLEEGESPMLVRSKDKSATGGADPVNQAEQVALAEGAQIVKGPPVPRPRFHPIATYGFGDVEGGKGGKPLQRGITFRSVQTTHDDTARTSGRAYLYFWPAGRTELASIQLRIGESESDSEQVTVLVAPLTGKVSVKPGPVDLEVKTDDDTTRQDTGF
jgi:general secretion pathway protein H